MVLGGVHDDTGPVGASEIDRDVNGIAEKWVAGGIRGAPVGDVGVSERSCGGVQFGEEICIKTVKGGRSAVWRRVGVVEFGHICDVGTVEPSMVV